MSHDELSLRSNDVVRCGVISLGQVDCMYFKHTVPGVLLVPVTLQTSSWLRCFLRIWGQMEQ
jgi:hypothetical protein